MKIITLITSIILITNLSATAPDEQRKLFKENCEKVDLKVETFILYSKNKFSSELKKEKGKSVRLLSLRNLAKLMDNLSEADALEYTNKKY